MHIYELIDDASRQALVIEINTRTQSKVFGNVFPKINAIKKTLELLEKKRRTM